MAEWVDTPSAHSVQALTGQRGGSRGPSPLSILGVCGWAVRQGFTGTRSSSGPGVSARPAGQHRAHVQGCYWHVCWAGHVQPRTPGHSQRLVSQRLQLVPVFVAELLCPLGRVRRPWLARHSAFHDLPRTGGQHNPQANGKRRRKRTRLWGQACLPGRSIYWGLNLRGGTGGHGYPNPRL